jgi:hypothetical protein
MNIRELVKLLRSFPGKSSVEIGMYFFDENEPRGHLDIVGVKHCQGCNTVVITGLFASEKPQLDAAMEEALARQPDQE